MRRINSHALAYTAGIIDGEGSICIVKYGKSGARTQWRYQIIVNVSNTNEWLINWMQFSFGGSISSYTKPTVKYKTCFQWAVRANQAAYFLKLVLPFLKIKRPQAELALLFQTRRLAAGSRKTDEQKALDEADKILMTKYNKKGSDLPI